MSAEFQTPGQILSRFLESNGMSKRELARQMGLSTKLVHDIIHKNARIKAKTAIRLERVTGIPAFHWLDMDSISRMEKERRRKT